MSPDTKNRPQRIAWQTIAHTPAVRLLVLHAGVMQEGDSSEEWIEVTPVISIEHEVGPVHFSRWTYLFVDNEGEMHAYSMSDPFGDDTAIRLLVAEWPASEDAERCAPILAAMLAEVKERFDC